MGCASWNVFLLQLKSHCDVSFIIYLPWMQSPPLSSVHAGDQSQDLLTMFSVLCIFPEGRLSTGHTMTQEFPPDFFSTTTF